MKTKIITVTATLVALSGCALGTPPMDIQPDPVDASQYTGLSCDQMADQYQQLQQDKRRYVDQQEDRRAMNRTMALWIAGFGAGDGQAAKDLARTKGEIQAIKQAAAVSGCELGAE